MLLNRDRPVPGRLPPLGTSTGRGGDNLSQARDAHMDRAMKYIDKRSAENARRRAKRAESDSKAKALPADNEAILCVAPSQSPEVLPEKE